MTYTASMIHDEGMCDDDCTNPEHDVEYTVTVAITLHAHDDEKAVDLVTEAIDDALSTEDVKVLLVTAHG